MKIRPFHASLASSFAVLIIVMVKHFEVVHTCRDSIVMATIYVVIVAITVYEKHNVENVYVQTSKVMPISDVILKHCRLCLWTSGTALIHALQNIRCKIVILFRCQILKNFLQVNKAIQTYEVTNADETTQVLATLRQEQTAAEFER